MNESIESTIEDDDDLPENPDILGRHWVQDLFPPAFGYTLQEIIDGRGFLSEEDNRKRSSEKEESDIFSQLSKVIPPADVAAIRNVYRRVWVMMRMKGKTVGDNQKQVGLNAESAEANKKTGDATSETSNERKSIWTTSEIDMLRNEFKSTKDSNKSLQAEIKILKVELLRVKSTEKSQKRATQSQATELHEAKNANMRLQLLCQNLKAESDRSEKIAAALRSDLDHMQSTLKQMTKQFDHVHKKLGNKQIEQDNLKLNVEEERRRADIVRIEFEEKVRRELDTKVKDVNLQINETFAELEKEKGRHRITLRGLEQLRVHFSGFSTTGGQNIVDKDQISCWTYN